MSDQSSATGSSATPSATDTAIKTAVAQVKEARAKAASIRGMPELAKIFREEKEPASETAEPKPAEVAPGAEAAKPEGATADPVADPAEEKAKAEATAAAERKSKRAEELAELARSGWEKVQARRAEKEQRTDLAKQKAELDAARAEIAAEKAKLEAATKDPFKFLEGIGVPPEELARRVIKRGDPSSQAEELRSDFEAWKKQQIEAAEADKRSREENQNRDRQAAQAFQMRQAEQRFVQLATDQTKYPALNALYTPEEILIKAHRVAQNARMANPDAIYEDSEIADFLEKEATPRIQKLREPPASAPKVPETPAANAGQPDQGHKSRTLNSGLQSEVTVDSAAFKKLPRAKQNQILAERLLAAKKK